MQPENAPAQTPAATPAAAAARPPPGEADFEAIYAAVMATERGRWFLCEYARRNRQTDTAAVLAAIDRLIAAARADAEALAPPDRKPIVETGAAIERLRTELADMANAIARAKSEIAAIKPAATKPDSRHGDRSFEATEQFDSVLRTTERATSEILAAADQIQEVAWAMREQGMEPQFCHRLDGYATEIYTACRFQDLTGQRTRKIIHVLRYLEARIQAMTGLWGAAPAAAAPDKPARSGDVVHNDVDRITAPAEPAEPIEETPPAAGPAGASHAIEGPKGSFSLVAEVAAEPQRPGAIPPPAAAEPPGKSSGEPDSVIADLRAFASDLVAEFRNDAAPPADAPPAALPPAVPAAAAPAIEPPPIAAEPAPQADAALPLAPAPQLAGMTQHPAQHPAAEPGAATPRRASDIAEDRFADVMMLTEEERIALFT